MKKLLFSIIVGFLSVSAFAQTKQYTMTEATLGLRSTLAPKDLQQISWIPGQEAFSQVVEAGKSFALIRQTVPAMKVDTIITIDRINKEVFGKEYLRRFPPIQWLSDKQFSIALGNEILLGSEENGLWTVKKWRTLPQEAASITTDNKTGQIAYTINNNLYLVNTKGENLTVTKDDNKGIVNGQTVHQSEFGIDGGIFFSPKGNYLAFYRMDESMVADYPIIDWSVTPAVNKSIKYPMAGSTSHHVTLGVFNPLTQKTVFLKTGLPEEQYLTCVSWSPDEQFIFIAVLNRDQNHLKLNKYDAKSGDFIKTLFEETDPKYVQPLHSLTFLPEKNDEFIWWSQRDGFMHLYRYSLDGKLLNQITKGDWVVNDLNGMNASKKELIISTSKESPMSKNVYAVNWTNGKMRRLENGFGMHSVFVSENGKFIIDKYSNPDVPRKIDILATTSKWSVNLLTAENTLADYQRPEIKDVTLKADDGTDLFGKIILPTNFDSNKKYPVVVYLYNGPNVQLLNNGFPSSGNLWYEYLAQRGYILFTMDGRGSSNRGLKFEQAVFRHLGTIEMLDQLKGVDYLKSLPYVDASRMGVHGWSYGGFMTTSLMLRHPDVFKVGVAGGPVIDWRMYEIMYTERYMDTPQQNPDGYEEANLLTKTGSLKGKLLMIHGANDPVVVWQHSMKFVKSTVDSGVQMDYFVYPGHKHNVMGKDRVHLMQKITDYFDEHLK